MRYKNEGPITLYAVVNTDTGKVIVSFTTMREARQQVTHLNKNLPDKHVMLTYDQRGTR